MNRSIDQPTPTWIVKSRHVGGWLFGRGLRKDDHVRSFDVRLFVCLFVAVKIMPSFQSSWAGERPGCWAGRLPGRWSRRRAAC